MSIHAIYRTRSRRSPRKSHVPSIAATAKKLVVRVNQAPAVAVDLIEEARGRLVRLLHNIAPHEDDVDVRAGLDVHPLEGLKQEARRWGATLVVVSESVHAFFRSPAEKIIHDFDIPVLVIPPRR